jgi:hypothetical protein
MGLRTTIHLLPLLLRAHLNAASPHPTGPLNRSTEVTISLQHWLNPRLTSSNTRSTQSLAVLWRAKNSTGTTSSGEVKSLESGTTNEPGDQALLRPLTFLLVSTSTADPVFQLRKRNLNYLQSLPTYTPRVHAPCIHNSPDTPSLTLPQSFVPRQICSRTKGRPPSFIIPLPELLAHLFLWIQRFSMGICIISDSPPSRIPRD